MTITPAAVAMLVTSAAHVALTDSQPGSEPADRAAIGRPGASRQPADVPSGDQSEGADEGHVMDELGDVTGAPVIEPAADTLGSGEGGEGQERQRQPPPLRRRRPSPRRPPRNRASSTS